MGCDCSCSFSQAPSNAKKYQEASQPFERQNRSLEVQIVVSNCDEDGRKKTEQTQEPQAEENPPLKPAIKYPANSEYATLNFNGDNIVDQQQNVKIRQGNYSIGGYSFSTDATNTKNFLGRGGFGKVFKGYSSSKVHPQVAIKVMSISSEGMLKLCRQETLRQQLMKSGGIVKIFMSKVIPIDQEKIFVIASELMDQGHLKIPEQGYQPQEALNKLIAILKCYQVLYRQGMAHRDLKPQNILTNSKGELKITDFGSAMQRTDKKQTTIQYTPGYASPQQAKNHEHTDKCDVYSLGCIFFQLLVGMTPKSAGCTKSFNKMDVDKLKKKLAAKNVSAQMVNFIEGCLKEKQLVLKQISTGEQIEDPQRSRLSWQQVFLHSLFKGQLDYIPKQVEGRNILLTVKTYADNNSVDLIALLNLHQQKNPKIKVDQLFDLFMWNNIPFSRSDMNRLERMFASQGYFSIKELIEEMKNLDLKQYSNYTHQESYAHLQMFDIYEEVNHQRLEKLMNMLKANKHHEISSIELDYANFTTFPLLPPFAQLKIVKIKHSNIQALEVRLNAPNLQTLELSYCQIQKILTIRGCPSLSILNLQENRIRQIEGLQMVSKVEKLILSTNRIKKINNIGHLRKLKILNLEDNRLSTVQGISSCEVLNQLILNYNKIRRIDNSLLDMKAPLRKIQLKFNMIAGTSENKSVLWKLRYQYPYKKVVLGAKESGQCDQDEFIDNQIYQLATFEEGSYKILSYSDRSWCIGMRQQSPSERFMQLSSRSNECSQIWHFQHYEDDQYCIFTHNQQEIVSCFNKCYINKYRQEQQKQTARFRWIFEKRGTDQNDYSLFSIRTMARNKRIKRGHGKQIQIVEKEQLNKRDLWYIEPCQSLY